MEKSETVGSAMRGRLLGVVRRVAALRGAEGVPDINLW